VGTLHSLAASQRLSFLKVFQSAFSATSLKKSVIANRTFKNIVTILIVLEI